MKKLVMSAGRWVLVWLWLQQSLVAVAADDSGRDWSVADSIAVRYVVRDFTLPGFLGGRDDGAGRIEWSPDRRHFFFVTRRGDSSCDCNAYELQIFSAAELEHVLGDERRTRDWRPQPRDRLQFTARRSDAFFQPITRAEWANNRSIVFMGIQGEAANQLYRFDVESRSLTRLTNAPQDVIEYSLSGESLMYMTFKPSTITALDTYPMVPIRGDELFQLAGAYHGKLELFSVHAAEPAKPLGKFSSGYDGPWLSPDGKHAVVALLLDGAEIPAAWAQYEIRPKRDNRSGAQFMLVDLEQGRMRPILDAPVGRATAAGWYTSLDVLWTRDSRHAVLINTALPLDDADVQRRNTAYIVDLDVVSGEWRIVDSLPGSATRVAASGARWIRSDREFALEFTTYYEDNKQSTVAKRYSRAGGGWTFRAAAVSKGVASNAVVRSKQQLSVTLRESADDPPIAFASNGKREVALLPPDPALQGLWRAKIRPVQWRERNGKIVTGGLLLPRRSEGPPPLVIQAYYYAPTLFLPDGTSTTAFAAQALVSAGMAVLMVDIPAVDVDSNWSDEVRGTIAEGTSFVERIDAAVEALATAQLIDPARVGVIGFSRSGFNVYYAMTHPGRTELAAAIVADSTTMSYGEYVASVATSPRSGPDAETDEYYGRGTFWQNKAAWMEHAPGFNVDRIRTPSLFVFNNKVNGVLALETLGALRMNRRPFEFVCFPAGSHQLQLPRERQASLQSTVDWMSFWLLNRQDADPAKADQYERWTKIRDDWRKRKLAEAATDAAPSKVRAEPASAR